MKKSATIIKSLLAGLAGVVSLTALSVSASTVAHYRFEDGSAGAAASTAIDSSGNGYDLNAIGEPVYSEDIPNTTIPRTGDANAQSIDLSQQNAAENTNNAFVGEVNTGLSSVQFTDFTVEAWVRFNSVGTHQTIVGRDDSGGTGSGFRSDSGHALVYFQNSPDGLRVEIVTIGNQLLAANTGFVPTAGEWYHVAAVGDTQAGENGTLTFYINGVQAASAGGFTGLANPTTQTPWTIGRGQWDGNPADWFNGNIDEVRISNSALSVDQFLNFDPTRFFIVSHPQNITVWSGMNATFSASFDWGEAVTPTFQWEVSTDNGASWSDLTGETDLTLTLSSVSAEMDRNEYRLSAVHDDGRALVTDAAVLRVGAGEPVAPAGVVAHYRFEGSPGNPVTSGIDSSGNGHHLEGAILGSPVYSSSVPSISLSQTGEANTSSLDVSAGAYGVTGVDGDSLSEIEWDDFTIEAWVNFGRVGGDWQTMVGRDDRNNQNNDNNPLLRFQVNGNGNFGFRATTRGEGDTTLERELTTSYVPPVNEWIHLAVVADLEAQTLIAYVNGHAVGQLNDFTGMWHPPGVKPRWTIGMGQWEGNQGEWTEGLIDEVRLSSTALTPVEFLNFHAAVLAFHLEPQDILAAALDTVTFSSLAGGGSGELAYQWQIWTDDEPEWNDIEGENGESLTVESVSTSMDGNQYRVVVTRGEETVVSRVATLEVPSYPVPEVITDLQSGPLALAGESFTYTVAATGLGNISYQWQFEGVDIEGETGASLTIDDITPADQGLYSVVISDDAATSEGFDPVTTTVSSFLAVAPRLRSAISLNFVGAGSGEWGSSPSIGVVQPNEEAGAFPVTNWNSSANVNGVATQATPIELVDDLGEPTTATATWSSGNTWSANAGAEWFIGSPNQRLFHGYIEDRGGSTVTVEGIPYDSYDVYVYPMGVEGASGTFARSVTLQAGEEETRQLFMRNLIGGPTPSEFPPFVMSHSTTLDDAVATPPATYFRFEGVSGSSIVLQHFDEIDWNSGGFAGISIVDTSESTPIRPGIVERPDNQFVPAGANVTLAVVAESYTEGGTLSYQWQFDGVNIPNGTEPSITLNDVSSSDAGQYTVIVTEDSPLGTSINTTGASVVVIDSDRPALINVDINVGSHQPMSGYGMLRTTGLVDFQYPIDQDPNAGPENPQANPMEIGLGDDLWNAVQGSEGNNTYGSLFDSQGLALSGVTLSITGAGGSGDSADLNPGGLESVPEFSSSLMRDYVFTEEENEMTVTLGGLNAFAGRDVTLVVYALGPMSTFDITHDRDDNATVTLAESNNYLGLPAQVTETAEEGREVRWNEDSFVVFEARVDAAGTVSWMIGPVPDRPGLNAMNGFQILLTAEGEPIEPPESGLADWREQYFGSPANEGDGANDADFDGDGFKNLVEYALGTDPTVPGQAHSALSLGRDGDFLTLTFNHIDDPNLVYVIEATNDLNGGWDEVFAYPTFTGAGTETYTDNVAVGAEDSRFIRLTIRLIE